MVSSTLRGVFAAVLTPQRDDLTCDTGRLASHCEDLLRDGCDGVSLFGTTGEGPAFTADERMSALESVLEAGVPADRLLPGTGCAALPDAVVLTRHAVGQGCPNVLVMPPFFFKDVSKEGVYRFYASLIEIVGAPELRIYLYNFPDMTGVWISRPVVRRLVAAYPNIVAGVKDSSGDWDYVTGLISDNPGMAVFSGWETLLPRLVAAGGAGCISGLANIIPGVLRRLYDNQRRSGEGADPLLEPVTELVEEMSGLPSVPALKSLAARLRREPAWIISRPPLEPLDTVAEQKLLERFGKIFGSPVAGC